MGVAAQRLVTQREPDAPTCHVDRLIGASDGHPVRGAIRQAERPVKSSISASGSYRRAKANTGRIIAALEAILTKHPDETDLLTAKPGSESTPRADVADGQRPPLPGAGGVAGPAPGAVDGHDRQGVLATGPVRSLAWPVTSRTVRPSGCSRHRSCQPLIGRRALPRGRALAAADLGAVADH